MGKAETLMRMKKENPLGCTNILATSLGKTIRHRVSESTNSGGEEERSSIGEDKHSTGELNLLAGDNSIPLRK
jgi:hypothetical protein